MFTEPNGKFSSPSVCQACGITFFIPAAWIRKGEGKFCSRECRQCPAGTKRVYQGYVKVKQDDGSWRHEHLIVAEEMIGRPLLKGEEVNHKNRDRSDNLPENLEVFTTKAAHMRMHGLDRRTRWSPVSDACIDCGSSQRPHKGNGRCNRCAIRWKHGTTGAFRNRRIGGKLLP